MGFLQQFLAYESVCIQCHNNPDADALASAYGVYCYFKKHGMAATIIYSGPAQIKKFSLKHMIEHCEIPIQYVEV